MGAVSREASGDARRGAKHGRSKAKEFMDAAPEAFVRDLALDRWRDYEALRETLGDARQALAEAGLFPGRGPYRPLWERIWREQVVAPMPPLDARLFGVIEAAVSAALAEELTARQARGDRPLDEDPEYKAFIDRALGNLFIEAAGEIERFEDQT